MRQMQRDSSFSLGAGPVDAPVPRTIKRQVAFTNYFVVRLRLSAVTGGYKMNKQEYILRLIELAKSLPVENQLSSGELEIFDDLVMQDGGTRYLSALDAQIDQRVQALPDSRSRMLESLSVAPDLLSPIAQERTEVAHTRALAHFLDSRKFSFAAACARALLEPLVGDIASHSESAKYVPTEVQAEHYIDAGNRADVFFRFGPWPVLIEAKIDAAEGPGQRLRYASWLLDIAEESAVLIYLTPDGDPTGDDAGPLPDNVALKYISMSYEQLLRLWLPLVSIPYEEKPTLSHARYLARYLKTIAVHVCEPPLAEEGSFSGWTPSTKFSCLDFVENMESVR